MHEYLDGKFVCDSECEKIRQQKAVVKPYRKWQMCTSVCLFISLLTSKDSCLTSELHLYHSVHSSVLKHFLTFKIVTPQARIRQTSNTAS